jgi:fructose-1,6-bisphosphatase I
MLVYSTGQGVDGFTLDPSIGEFLLSHPGMRIPEKGPCYSVNEGHSSKWDAATHEFVRRLKSGEGPSKRPYSLRYVGSLVSDVHRTLLRGGIFLYPAIRKPSGKWKSKLRLLYEANPMAFLVEQAGGKAISGKERILDIAPTDLHQTVPLIIGSRLEVDLYETLYRQHAVPGESVP